MGTGSCEGSVKRTSCVGNHQTSQQVRPIAHFLKEIISSCCVVSRGIRFKNVAFKDSTCNGSRKWTLARFLDSTLRNTRYKVYRVNISPVFYFGNFFGWFSQNWVFQLSFLKDHSCAKLFCIYQFIKLSFSVFFVCLFFRLNAILGLNPVNTTLLKVMCFLSSMPTISE